MTGPAEQLFDQLESEAALEDLLNEEETESLHFDFKNYSTEDDKSLQKHLGKAISGFANADGGVLVLGVDDQTHKVVPDPNFKRKEEKIQEMLSRVVSFPVKNATTKSFESTSEVGSGFIVVYVPASDLAPHRSQKDHKYYQRSGESFIPMEHYQVADMFGRRHHPHLFAYLHVDSSDRATLGIGNDGRSLAEVPYLEIRRIDGEHDISQFGIDGNGAFGLNYPYLMAPKGRVDSNRKCYFFARNGQVVHSNSELDVLRLSVSGAICIELVLAGKGVPARNVKIVAPTIEVSTRYTSVDE